MSDDILQKYHKTKAALRWRCFGYGFHLALEVLEYVENLNKDPETGQLLMRKDGKTPKFYHEIRQAGHALTLKDVQNMEGLIVTILCHDVLEDFGIPQHHLLQKIGVDNYNSVWAMTKKYLGDTKNLDQVFRDIGEDPNASLAKLLDRIDNFQSMPGVFNKEKQLAYIQEGRDRFLPMAKAARKRFTRQTDAYLNLSMVLKYQMELLSLINQSDT